ncbi:MAG: efflux RND transporter periplasmic adaptor subunit [Candidatus Aminicenantales bacterium]
MKKKLVFIIIGLVVVAGVIFALTGLKSKKNGAVKYRTETVSKGDIEALVVTSGTLNPVKLVEVGSQVSGEIAEIYVDFNSQVKKGQLLAVLDQTILKSKIDQNQSNYMSALASLERSEVTLDNLQKKNERAKTLFEKDLISIEEKDAAEVTYLGAKTDVTSAKARAEQAKAQLESSKVDLTYATIKSPIDGVVINRLVNVGQTVQASFSAPKLFEIANDLAKMQVDCAVDEADIGVVKEGQSVRFQVDAFPNENFKGIVKQVRYAATTASNVVTYMTIVEVENPELKLRPGMTATVSIIANEAKDVLRVSNAALRFTPTLTDEEMQKMGVEMKARMDARRVQRSGQPGASPQGAAQGEGQPVRRSVFGPGAAGAAARQPTRVWAKNPDGKLLMIPVQAGITDGAFTQILRGDLKEGQEIIAGLASSVASTATQGNQNRMMMMGGPR